MVFVASQEERPRRCFLCVGLALRLGLDDPNIEELTHEFYIAGDVSKHLQRKHLKNDREGDDIWYRAFDIQLVHKMYLQSPALRYCILASSVCPRGSFNTCHVR
jgi:hypothetical protein